MNPYRRRVQYYETDGMGIVHHANYIHWMEEARIDFMDQLGYPYAQMEAEGVASPVRAMQCAYKKPCAFGDSVDIAVSVRAFNGVVLTIGYEMRRCSDGAVVFEGQSEHVFVGREGRLVRMRRDMPGFCDALEALIPRMSDA